ncbi:MAG: hypothetical protein AAGA09_01395 [Pseudomonadota bacterium]
MSLFFENRKRGGRRFLTPDTAPSADKKGKSKPRAASATDAPSDADAAVEEQASSSALTASYAPVAVNDAAWSAPDAATPKFVKAVSTLPSSAAPNSSMSARLDPPVADEIEDEVFEDGPPPRRDQRAAVASGRRSMTPVLAGVAAVLVVALALGAALSGEATPRCADQPAWNQFNCMK